MHRRTVVDERGSTSLELVIWGLALLLLMSLVIFGGRVAQAGLTVESAAGEAARAATVAANRAQAGARAHDAAEQAFTSAGLRCSSVSVSVDTSQWTRPEGQPARVSATATCQVALSDLVGISLLPGSRTVTASASSALDRFRVRS